MKNLLISKSFSYEIVDFTLLWQTNTYHLGKVYYIHMTKKTYTLNPCTYLLYQMSKLLQHIFKNFVVEIQYSLEATQLP